MKSGPKQTLTPAVRLLRGSRKRARHTEVNTPLAVVGPLQTLKQPRWLSPRAKDFWHAWIAPRQFAEWQELEAVQYCTSRASWEQELQTLQQEGTVLESPGGLRYANPRVKVVHDLAKALGELTVALGLAQAVPVVVSAEEQAQAQAKSKARFFR